MMNATATPKLLPRQERFAREFARTLCLTKAARIAQYANPRRHGWRLYHRHAGVRQRIDELLAAQEPGPSYSWLWRDAFIRNRVAELLERRDGSIPFSPTH